MYTVYVRIFLHVVFSEQIHFKFHSNLKWPMTVTVPLDSHAFSL